MTGKTLNGCAGFQQSEKEPYHTDDLERFKALCKANIETYFDYEKRSYFVTNREDGDFTWFVCDGEPFARNLSIVPVSGEHDSLDGLFDEKIFDGKTKSIRDCYREFDLWQS